MNYEITKQEKRISEEVTKRLKQDLHLNVTTGFVYGNENEGTEFLFYVWNNKYDYTEIQLASIQNLTKEIKNLEDKDLLNIYTVAALQSLKDKGKNTEEHKSTAEERYVVDILEENNVKDLYVLDGCLYSKEFTEGIDLDDISSLNYSTTDKILHLMDYGLEEFSIDINKEEITWITKNVHNYEE